MADDISRAAAGILPGARLDAMIYACTSGTAAIGEDEIARRVHQSRPGIMVSNPLTAAIEAFNALKVSRVSLLTPYDQALNHALVTQFEARGIQILNAVGLGFQNDLDIAAIPPARLAQWAKRVCDDDAQALFISCTALRVAGVTELIERSIGKPVVSSNQALAWHALNAVGYTTPISGFGQLLQTRL